MLEALIFDVDGTLAETEELHRRAFNETFAAAGLDWHWSRATYATLLKTTGGKERIARYLRDTGRDGSTAAIADLHDAKTARYVDLMDEGEITLRPGIAALITQAQSAGLRLAIATTTSRANVDALCQSVFATPANDVFEVIACGDMVAAKKPAPDVYLLALGRLNLAACRALALEDSRNGMKAAKAAGLRCCIAPGDYTRDEDFTEADLLIGEFSDLGGLAGLDAMREEGR